MDWFDVKVFLEVSSARSMRKAAANLHLAQSAVSLRIRHLEQELGFPLFQRTPKGVRLTEKGELFRSHAAHVVSSLQKEISMIKADPKPDKIRIGVTSPLTYMVLPVFVDYLRRSFPGMVLEIATMESREIWRGIRSGELKAGFLSSPEPLTGVRAHHLFEQDFLLAVPRQLARKLDPEGKGHVPLPLLPTLSYVLPNETTSLRQLIADTFLKFYSRPPAVVAEADSTSLLLKLVEMNVGCTILTVPSLAAFPFQIQWIRNLFPVSGTVDLKPLSPHFPKRPVYFIHSEHANIPPPDIAAILSRLREDGFNARDLKGIS